MAFIELSLPVEVIDTATVKIIQNDSTPPSIKAFIDKTGGNLATVKITGEMRPGTICMATCKVMERGLASLMITIDDLKILSESTAKPIENEDKGRWVDGFFIGPEQSLFMKMCKEMMQRFKYINALVVGRPGLGKTSLAKLLAKELNFNFVKVDCGLTNETSDLFHTLEAADGRTFLVPSELAIAIEQGNSVILLDEINRAKPTLMNGLIGLLDDTRRVYLNGKVYMVAENVIFIASANVGSRFTGTYTMDDAHKRRFPLRFEVRNLPFDMEKKLLMDEGIENEDTAITALRVISELRKGVDDEKFFVECGTDLSRVIARLYAITKSLRVAFEFTILQACSGEDRKELSDLINMKLGTLKI